MGGNWSSRHFAEFQPSQSKIDICLFKLHGSTCWAGEIKSLGSFARFEGEPDYGLDGEENSPFEIVYPGFRREVWLGKEYWHMPGLEGDTSVDWSQREPYSVLYKYLDECLANSTVMVVIGYAFGDHDINSRFVNAFRQNKLFHMIVVDPGRKFGIRSKGMGYEPPYQRSMDLTDLEPEAWNNRLHWIRGKFGTKRMYEALRIKVESILDATSQ